MNEINVIVCDFHTTKGKELVTLNEDGSYTVLINSRLDQETAQKAYLHAVNHINNEDFEGSDVQCIEWDCHENV